MSYKILIVGDNCTDVYKYGNCERKNPEADAVLFQHDSQKDEEKRGMCLNVADNIESIGLGDVDVQILTHKDKIIKEKYFNSKTNVQVFRCDLNDKTNERLSSYDLNCYIKNCSAVVISDYNKGFVDIKGVIELIELAKNKNIPIFVDTKKTDLSYFNNCIIKINEQENNKITKLPNNTYDLIITCGENGANWKEKIYPTEKIQIRDVCGAGDVFLAGLVIFYLKTKGNIGLSIECANICASESVKHLGNYVVKIQDIKEKINKIL
jgi:bifunctional ADP-heptose synthase (sugar kinase/adenylyltransferase)